MIKALVIVLQKWMVWVIINCSIYYSLEAEKGAYEVTIFSAVEKLRRSNRDTDKKKDSDLGIPKDIASTGVTSGGQGPTVIKKGMEEELAARKNPTESLDEELVSYIC